jgi:hypothetical protein
MCQDILPRYYKYTEEGMDEPTAAKKAYRFVENRILDWPDLPPMFDC